MERFKTLNKVLIQGYVASLPERVVFHGSEAYQLNIKSAVSDSSDAHNSFTQGKINTITIPADVFDGMKNDLTIGNHLFFTGKLVTALVEKNGCPRHEMMILVTRCNTIFDPAVTVINKGLIQGYVSSKPQRVSFNGSYAYQVCIRYTLRHQGTDHEVPHDPMTSTINILTLPDKIFNKVKDDILIDNVLYSSGNIITGIVEKNGRSRHEMMIVAETVSPVLSNSSQTEIAA